MVLKPAVGLSAGATKNPLLVGVSGLTLRKIRVCCHVPDWNGKID